MSEKLKPSEGDKVVFEYVGGKWKMHVEYASGTKGAVSGQIAPHDSFAAAVASLKQTLEVS